MSTGAWSKNIKRRQRKSQKMPLKRLPSAVRDYYKHSRPDWLHVRHGDFAAARLKACNRNHIKPSGPVTVRGLCQWPKRCVEDLWAADQIDFLGHPQRDRRQKQRSSSLVFFRTSKLEATVFCPTLCVCAPTHCPSHRSRVATREFGNLRSLTCRKLPPPPHFGAPDPAKTPRHGRTVMPTSKLRKLIC